MARHLRVEFPGAIYHVTCRMIGDGRLDQSRLFTEDAERIRFLERLGERVQEYNIRMYQFVLMTNHFHLVFETPAGNCSKFMQSLLTAYTVYYNIRHGRHGHLLDGRFKARLVDGDEYLLALTRYVHLNPVMVGGIKNQSVEERIRYLRGYRWSTYPGYIGQSKRHDFVAYGPVLGEMNGKKRDWPRRYREYVETGLGKTDDEFDEVLKASPRSIGGDGFRAWVDELYGKLMDGHKVREDIAFRHVTEPLDSGQVLEVVGQGMGVGVEEFRSRRRDSVLRAVATRYLIRYAGLSQREVAKTLNAGSGSAISKQMRRYKEALDEKKLAGILAGIERRLSEERRKRCADSVNS